jgi:hypothetical protein
MVGPFNTEQSGQGGLFLVHVSVVIDTNEVRYERGEKIRW